MRHNILLLGLVAGTFLNGAAATRPPARFYVSSDGNDAWSGTLREPATEDGPFATLTRARDAVRELIKAGLDNDVCVYICGGRTTCPRVSCWVRKTRGPTNIPFRIWRIIK